MTTALDTTTATRLRAVVMRLSRRLRQRAGAQLTSSQMSAMGTLDRRGPLALRDLAAAEQIAPSTLTRIVATLEDEGLLDRRPDPTDRRVALVGLTPAGRALLAVARRRSSEHLATRIEALRAEEQAALVAALPVLERLLGDDA